MLIKEFLPADVCKVKLFTDQCIGLNYYSVEELTEYQKKSITSDNEVCSFILVDPETTEIKGLRLAFPPGNWSHGKGSRLRVDLWPNSLSQTAYFQSLFIAPELQNQGWGRKLSYKSIEIFKRLGALGIATHCWKESPNNTSYKYLSALGFKTIVEHPDYWIDVDYTCTRDGKPCRCTALEMYLHVYELPK